MAAEADNVRFYGAEKLAQLKQTNRLLDSVREAALDSPEMASWGKKVPGVVCLVNSVHIGCLTLPSDLAYSLVHRGPPISVILSSRHRGWLGSHLQSWVEILELAPGHPGHSRNFSLQTKHTIQSSCLSRFTL